MQRVIDFMLNEVGYLEKKSDAFLEDKTANAGSNNYTKYGKEMGCNGQPWCDAFQDYCFVHTYGKETARTMLGGFSNYTPTSAAYFKNKGRWSTEPKVGAQVFFKNSVRICHVGLVYAIDENYIYTIEGNTSGSEQIVDNGGAVCKKQYLINNPRIAGYGMPLYELVESRNEMYGIDISSNQGTIDFKKVKNAGVEFIVIRATTKNNNPDVRLAEYVKGCRDNNIPIAFYKYMYATTEDAARIEAQKAIAAITNVGVIPSRDTTIYADVEDKTQFALSTSTLSFLVKIFRSEVEAAGFSFGLYMSKSPYESGEVDAKEFDNDIWLARYPYSGAKSLHDVPDSKFRPMAINGNLIGWQWSSKGVVDGIKGDVDLDVFYGTIKEAAVSDRYFAKPEFTLVESLNKIGAYSSFANRKLIAAANGINGYTGSAEQNLLMLGLLNAGELKMP